MLPKIALYLHWRNYGAGFVPSDEKLYSVVIVVCLFMLVLKKFGHLDNYLVKTNVRKGICHFHLWTTGFIKSRAL